MASNTLIGALYSGSAMPNAEGAQAEVSRG